MAVKPVKPLAFVFRPSLLVRRMLRRVPGLSLQTRLDLDLFPRPYYAYGIHQAALLAKRLGNKSMSALEFGVAGGAGLVMIEQTAEEIGKAVGIDIQVFGFDTGGGLPPPEDNRDLPYVWKKGFYTIDESALRKRLQRAKLIFGLVRETVADFVEKYQPGPIGFVSFDFDYYSSTVDALTLFEQTGPAARLPRIFCYFDDIIGPDEELHCDAVGELAAIADFNRRHSQQHIGRINGLAHKRIFHSAWCEQMFVLHDLTHPKYGQYISPERQKEAAL